MIIRFGFFSWAVFVKFIMFFRWVFCSDSEWFAFIPWIEKLILRIVLFRSV